MSAFRVFASTLVVLLGLVPGAFGQVSTATSDFFISIGAQPLLDDGGERSPDGLGFAAFGRVVSGMDVVRKIQASRTPAGTPATKVAGRGQTLAPTVKIRRAYRAIPANGYEIARILEISDRR